MCLKHINLNKGFADFAFITSVNYSQFAFFLLFKVKLALCRPQTAFFPIIKVSPQFLIRGISSIKPLIQRFLQSPPSPLMLSSVICCTFSIFSLHPVPSPCTYCRPSGLQACMHTFKVKKEKKCNKYKERGEH